MGYGPCGSDYRLIENVSVVAKSAFKSRFNRVPRRLKLGRAMASQIVCSSPGPLIAIIPN